ncbi:MAG: copper amine oxidase N-terminal domain-containing protein [Firmicutes bacterium]|nr:copper amine oxidase N-terminal domain-containing protein [Bacillota bacterium]
MKKLITGVCCAAMLFANMTFASDDSQIKVYLDNEKVSYDVGPVVTDKGPMIPLRFTLEGMGGVVKWNNENRTVLCEFEGRTGLVTIDSEKAAFLGDEIELDRSTMLVEGRTMVDTEFIKELTDMNIETNQEEMSIIISNLDEESEYEGEDLVDDEEDYDSEESEQDRISDKTEEDDRSDKEISNNKIKAITEAKDKSPLDKVFSKRKDVFGVKIFATDGVSDKNFNHAVNIMAEYLDNDEDGSPDNKAVVEKLLEKEAAMILFKNENEEEKMMDKYGDIFDSLTNEDSLQNLYNEEIHVDGAKKGEFDASYEEILHLITHVGYADVYPKELGEKPGTDIANAMDIARGGQFIKIPKKYPEKAWYSYYDDTADYSTMVTEYVYWALTSMLGAQDFEGRYEEINEEWKLNTKDKVMSKDKGAYEILTNAKYKLPSRLPDGKYEVK